MSVPLGRSVSTVNEVGCTGRRRTAGFGGSFLAGNVAEELLHERERQLDIDAAQLADTSEQKDEQDAVGYQRTA